MRPRTAREDSGVRACEDVRRAFLRAAPWRARARACARVRESGGGGGSDAFLLPRVCVRARVRVVCACVRARVCVCVCACVRVRAGQALLAAVEADLRARHDWRLAAIDQARRPYL